MNAMSRFGRVASLVVCGSLAMDLSAAEPDARPQRPANRLAKETSPYLLLHAHNPVDWHPWGAEALAKAKAEKKLIFLSIGYSSCYWCHVMERESFMDDEIAALLNKHFVCIKVDREERPDVDEIYMTALQLYYQVLGSARGGGWPLSMFLTPDARPIGGGSYFPPRDKDGADGFLTVVGRVQQLWQTNPQQLQQTADMLTDYVRQTLVRRRGLPAAMPQAAALEEVQRALAEEFDPQHGGFGFSEANPRRPKFPEPSNLMFLLDRAGRSGDAQARSMLVATLEKMAAGGIRDHLGGGFHRYSTDRAWRVPHFEKMLYDNGQLASVYAQAWQLTQREDFRQAAEEILVFVAREMTSPQGAFYTALDAETEAAEGRYYVWEKAELEKLLAPAEFDLLADLYGFRGPANFEERYVLLMTELPQTIAQRRKITPAELQLRARPAKEKLLAARGRRPRPLTDTKILTASNGLMIRGYADCGRIFHEPRYTRAAVKAADFVLARLRTDDGRLLRTYAGGQAKLAAYLDDYAFLIDGLIGLHQATGEQRWLQQADSLMADQLRWFSDPQGGGFFYTASDHEELIARSKDPIDKAEPSGNSVSAGNLVYLGVALNKPEYFKRAEETIRDAAPLLERAPGALPRMAVALAALLDATRQQENEQ
jgi:uncharacterized protein YyaL (SSP411 family)